ncbi:lamin tail domain-containing protein [Streptomyces sp. NPDC005355]|uniref:lamin tail domain-containing protein n=1 Tax=Streptomyces sp. NPDC005355 TaxID=3157038 RepID=UPI0033A13671
MLPGNDHPDPAHGVRHQLGSASSEDVVVFKTFTLRAGKSVYMHTGRGTNTASNVYQGRGAYVWNNDHDTATLRKSSGTRVDSCSYNNSHRSYVYPRFVSGIRWLTCSAVRP